MSEYIVCPHCHNPLSSSEYVKVVRCRDCKHMHVFDVSAIYGNHEHDTVFCLRFVDGMRMTVEPDGFCAWSERRQP